MISKNTGERQGPAMPDMRHIDTRETMVGGIAIVFAVIQLAVAYFLCGFSIIKLLAFVFALACDVVVALLFTSWIMSDQPVDPGATTARRDGPK